MENLKKIESLLFSIELNNVDESLLEKNITIYVDEVPYEYKIVKEGNHYYFVTA